MAIALYIWDTLCSCFLFFFLRILVGNEHLKNSLGGQRLLLTSVAHFRGETEYSENHWSRHGEQWDPKLLRWGFTILHLHDAHVQQLRLRDAHVQWLLYDAHIQCQRDAHVQQCSHSPSCFLSRGSHRNHLTSTSFQQLHFPPSSVSPNGQPFCFADILQPLHGSVKSKSLHNATVSRQPLDQSAIKPLRIASLQSLAAPATLPARFGAFPPLSSSPG